MEGFGVHTFRLLNAKGESTFVKFHWKPKLGLQSVVWNEAVKINGADPDFHRRDLWDAIQSRRFPGMGAAAAAVRPGLRRQLRFRHPRRDQIIPEEVLPVTRSAAWCSTACPTISSPRPSRSRS
jgi:catalase